MILFKRDTDISKVVPYINMRECKDGFGMIQNVRKKFDNFNREEI